MSEVNDDYIEVSRFYGPVYKRR